MDATAALHEESLFQPAGDSHQASAEREYANYSYVRETIIRFFQNKSAAISLFLIILIVARCFDRFRSSKIISGAMSGLKPAVVGLISAAILSIAKAVVAPTGVFAVNTGLAVSLVIFAIALFLVLKKKAHPVLIICMGAALGVAAGYMGLLPL